MNLLRIEVILRREMLVRWQKKDFVWGKKIMSMGEAEDKAFNFVRAKLKAKYGDGVLTTGEKMKPPTAAQKKAAAVHKEKIAKQQAADV